MAQISNQISNNEVNALNVSNEIPLCNTDLIDVKMVSLDLYQNLPDDNMDIQSPDFIAELEKKISIQKLLMKLKKVERKVIFEYYFEGRTFKEIGQMLNLTESRISQIHKKALARLKQFIGDFYL
jgi:RNA polymerase sigma factor for flagellar operon FliA